MRQRPPNDYGASWIGEDNSSDDEIPRARIFFDDDVATDSIPTVSAEVTDTLVATSSALNSQQNQIDRSRMDGLLARIAELEYENSVLKHRVESLGGKAI